MHCAFALVSVVVAVVLFEQGAGSRVKPSKIVNSYNATLLAMPGTEGHAKTEPMLKSDPDVETLDHARHYEDFYQTLSAEKKSDLLWSFIQAKKEQGEWPSTIQLMEAIEPTRILGLRTHGIDVKGPSGFRVSDFFVEGRPKVIHSVGGVAKASFEWNENGKQKYTGGFKGADHLILRFSSATQPSDGTSTPALSVKMLRTGQPSGNFMAMWSLNSMNSQNFFAKPLCNHVSTANLALKVKLLVKKFKEADPRPSMIGFKDLAEYTQDGAKESNIKVPFALVFQPNPVLTDKYKNAQIDEEDGNYADYMGELKANTVLYRVFAVDGPLSKSVELIGQLVLKSKIVKSAVADGDLLFKHNFMNEELATNEDTKQWEQYLTEEFLKEESVERYEPELPPWKDATIEG